MGFVRVVLLYGDLYANWYWPSGVLLVRFILWEPLWFVSSAFPNEWSEATPACTTGSDYDVDENATTITDDASFWWKDMHVL